jgi:hypothetical protein
MYVCMYVHIYVYKNVYMYVDVNGLVLSNEKRHLFHHSSDPDIWFFAEKKFWTENSGITISGDVFVLKFLVRKYR